MSSDKDELKERRNTKSLSKEPKPPLIRTTRSQFLQKGKTDIEKDNDDVASDLEEVNEEIINKLGSKGITEQENKTSYERKEYLDNDPKEGPSGSGMNSRETESKESTEQLNDNVNRETDNNKIERYGNYLQKYGPHLERYGNQLERFGNQLERIGPQLERCGNNLEKYGPQLEAISRQLDRSMTTVGNSSTSEVGLRIPQPNIQTQTESGNEGFTPQSADSCQGSSSQHLGRQGQWISSQNTRRLSRRPSFQINDGLIRHWMRRRNVDNRDDLSFRLRDDRRRSIWRNDGDIRELRRARISSWRGHENFRRQYQNSLNATEDNNLERSSLHQINYQNDIGSNQNSRIQRNEEIHQDDPNYGFVLIDHQNLPGPSSSRPDTSVNSANCAARRPRSNMSLSPLNVLSPPFLGPIFEYNAESDDENNDPRPNHFGRRTVRGREGNVIRSFFMMNNYFQPRPLFIGQGDSKAIDGLFTLQSIPLDVPLQNGNNETYSL